MKTLAQKYLTTIFLIGASTKNQYFLSQTKTSEAEILKAYGIHDNEKSSSASDVITKAKTREMIPEIWEVVTKQPDSTLNVRFS